MTYDNEARAWHYVCPPAGGYSLWLMACDGDSRRLGASGNSSAPRVRRTADNPIRQLADRRAGVQPGSLGTGGRPERFERQAQQYDDKGIQFVLNGKGRTIEIVVREGGFPIKPGARYLVRTDTVKNVGADKKGTLSFHIRLDGQSRIKIEPAHAR